MTLSDLHSNALAFRQAAIPLLSSVVAWTKTSFPPPSPDVGIVSFHQPSVAPGTMIGCAKLLPIPLDSVLIIGAGLFAFIVDFLLMAASFGVGRPRGCSSFSVREYGHFKCLPPSGMTV